MRKGTAYHEAGHAVAALVLAADDVSATIEADEESLGRVDYSPPRVAPVSKAVIVCAGPCAEWRVMNDGEDGKDCIDGRDAERFLELIEEIEPDLNEQKPRSLDLYVWPKSCSITTGPVW